jgi:hypothetical protein
VAIALLAAPGVIAQDGDAGESSGAEAVMGAGDIDIGLGGGLGGLIYPHLAPTVDVGVLPLGSVVLSAGATVDGGYCLLCDIVTSASDWNVNSYYLAILARAMVHIRDLAEEAGPTTPIDPYVGLVGGPRFYRFVVEYKPDGDSARFNLNTIMLGPNAGAKFFFGDELRWFAFAELRYLFEFGFESTKVEVGGVTYEVTSDDYRSGGLDFGIGAGLRL